MRRLAMILALGLGLACDLPDQKPAQTPNLAPNPARIVVLSYHAVVPDADKQLPAFRQAPFVVGLEAFRSQMQFLHDEGYHTLSLAESQAFLQGGAVPDRSVLLTFDDGNKTFPLFIAPVLRQYGLHGTAFIITGRLLDHPEPFKAGKLQAMSWDELKGIRDVLELGGHTHKLHELDPQGHSILLATTPQAMLADFLENRRLLEASTGQKPIGFAYPFGKTNQVVLDTVTKAGFEVAFVGGNQPMAPGTPPLLIPRYPIVAGTSLSAFRAMLAPPGKLGAPGATGPAPGPQQPRPANPPARWQDGDHP